MGEIVERATSITARWANSGAVAPGVQALCTIAGIAAGEPAIGAAVGVGIGAAVGSAAEELTNAGYRLWTNRVEHLERFAETATAASGVTLDDLLADAARRPETLELLSRTAGAAARSLDEWKIDMLARVFVDACRTELIDEIAVVIDALAQLESPHVQVLALIAQPGPHLMTAAPTDDGEIPGERAWRDKDIDAALPGLKPVRDGLIAKLLGLGLIRDLDVARYVVVPAWVLTGFGERCAEYLGRRAGPIEP